MENKAIMNLEHNDPIEHISNVFDGIFRLVTPNPVAMDHAGITGLSQKIVGLPGWHIWIAGDSGAYQLELHNVNDSGGDGSNAREISGDFLIKYYPAMDAKEFDKFSQLERLARGTDYFDSTGAPAIEKAEYLPDNLFVVGCLSIFTDYDSKSLRLTLEAPNIWKTTIAENVELRLNGLAPITLEKGLIDRQVPGKALSLRLLDALARSIAIAHRVGPCKTADDEAPGYLYSLNSQGKADETEDPEVRIHRYELSYNLSDGCDEHRQGQSDDVIQARCVHSETPNAEWAKPEWWNLALIEIPSECAAPC